MGHPVSVLQRLLHYEVPSHCRISSHLPARKIYKNTESSHAANTFLKLSKMFSSLHIQQILFQLCEVPQKNIQWKQKMAGLKTLDQDKRNITDMSLRTGTLDQMTWMQNPKPKTANASGTETLPPPPGIHRHHTFGPSDPFGPIQKLGSYRLNDKNAMCIHLCMRYAKMH